MSSELPEREDIMPKISLKDASEQLIQMQTKRIAALSPNAEFTAIKEIDADISFEASLLYYLVRNQNRGLVSIIQDSFFTPDMTVFVLKELVNEKQVRKIKDEEKEQQEGKEDRIELELLEVLRNHCLLYTSPSPRDQRGSRMPSSA